MGKEELELWGSDPFSNDPVVSRLWNSVGVIPVLPPQPELRLFSVLRKGCKPGHYTVIGDLGTLCAEALGKPLLQKMVAEWEMDNSPEKLFTTHAPRTEDQSWSLELLNLLGFTLRDGSRLSGGHTTTTIHEQEAVSASNDTILDMLKAFLPDTKHPSLRPVWSKEGHIVEVLVVQQLVRARQIDIMVSNMTTPSPAAKPSARSSRSPLLHVALEDFGRTFRNYQITARDAEGRNNKPVPLGFRAVRATYCDGILIRANPSAHEIQVSATHIGGKDGPLDDDNLREFLEQPHWYATIDRDVGKDSPTCCDHLGIMCTIL